MMNERMWLVAVRRVCIVITPDGGVQLANRWEQVMFHGETEVHATNRALAWIDDINRWTRLDYEAYLRQEQSSGN